MKKLVLLMAAVMTMGFVACTDNGGKKVEEASAAQTEEVSAAPEEETSMAAEETSAAQESSAVKATTDKTEEVKSEASAPAEKK